MAVLTVAGVDFPTPTELSIGIQTLVKAERNTKGTMIAERIATKQKLDISYAYLSAAQLATVLSTIQAAFFFTVTYIDPLTNATRTGTFYAGDQTGGVMDIRNGVVRYKDIKFPFIER